MSPGAHAGLYYEDVEVGSTLETRGHRITTGDITRFSELTHDHHPLHRDDDFARQMGFPARIAHGLFGLCLMEGLKAELGLYETTSVASLGWDDVRFRRPMLVDDMVRTRVRFESKRPSSKPGRGVVVEIVELRNQRDEPVITAKHATLLITRNG